MALALRQRSLLCLITRARASQAIVENSSRASLAYKALDDKERGEENIRFRKEDERLLRQLLNKVKQQADAVDVHEAANTVSVDLSSLKEILGKYNVSDEDLQKVLEWKHT